PGRGAPLDPPYLVTAADTLFRPGDVARFVDAFAASRAAGAIAVRVDPEKTPIAIDEGRVVGVVDVGGVGPWSGAPLWAVGDAVHERLCLDAKPYELSAAFQGAVDAGEVV